MARPVYESESDRRVEREIAESFAERWRCSFHHLRRLSQVDAAIMQDDKVVAWAEIKRRRVPAKRYPTILLSAEKAAHGVNLSQLTEMPFLFLVRFDDCDAYVKVEQRHLKQLRIMGRTDRGDEADVEPCIEIDAAELKVA